MELVSLAKEMLQSAAEWAASYRVGQTALRHVDRALWVVEKCARWAVPPPLDQDDRPQPELVRPLPWVFFLALLITLRVTRESISLINLVMGKPPLRSADVVMYIQSKRRYLRTLKYQGNRMMRARTVSSPPPRSWYSRAQSLFEFTMCFRNSHNYGNNNTTHVSNNDEVMVVKRSKRRPAPAANAPSAETTMERLIEKMMQDLAADSDDDSSFTLTNVTSIRSDQSDTPESDQDTILHHDASTPRRSKVSDPDSSATSNETENSPEKNESHVENISIEEQEKSDIAESQHETQDVLENEMVNEVENKQENNDNNQKQETSETAEKIETSTVVVSKEDAVLQAPTLTPRSPKDDSQMLLQHERGPTQQSPNNERKNVNGQIVNSPSKKKGLNSDQRLSEPSNISM